MHTQHASAHRQTDSFQPGRFRAFHSFFQSSVFNLQSAILTLLLLVALAPPAEATWATGGTMTNYTDRRSVAWGARASAKQQGDKP